MLAKGRTAQTLSRGLENGIADGGPHGSYWGLTYDIETLMAGQRIEMDTNARQFVTQPQHGILMEIGIRDRAVANTNFLVEGHVEAEQGTAFDLTAHGILIRHPSTVEGHVHLSDREASTPADMYPRHGTNDGAGMVCSASRPAGDGYAHPLAGLKLLPPAGLVRRHAQTVRPGSVPLGNQMQPICQRINARSDSAFVDKGFDKKRMGIVAGSAIGAVHDMDGKIRSRDMDIGDDATGEIGHIIVTQRELEQGMRTHEAGF